MNFDAPLSRCPSCLGQLFGSSVCASCGWGTKPEPTPVADDIRDFIRDGGKWSHVERRLSDRIDRRPKSRAPRLSYGTAKERN